MQLIHSIITTDETVGLLPVGDDRAELYGYAVTMEGRIVAQEWPEDVEDYIGDDLLWEDLRPAARQSRRAA